MQAVFGFVPDDGIGAVNYVFHHLFAPVGRQAVEEYIIGPGVGNQLIIDLVRRKVLGRWACSASCPMLAQTSVTTTSASFTASTGSLVMLMLTPCFRASCLARK